MNPTPQQAREVLSPLGVLIWEDPAPMTLSAPAGAFRDLQVLLRYLSLSLRYLSLRHLSLRYLSLRYS